MNVGALQPDELLEIPPEPCGFCTTGIRWMFCYDNQWRCRSCVRALAEANGWNALPEPVEETVDSLQTVIQKPVPMENTALPFD